MNKLKEEKNFLYWGKNLKLNTDKVPLIFETKENKMFCRNKKHFNPDLHLLDYNTALNTLNKKEYQVYNCKVNGIGYWLESAKYGVLDIDNCFIDNTETPRYFFKRLIDIANEKKSCIFYSKSKRGLHIPFLVKDKVNMPYTANKLENFSIIDIETNVLDNNGNPKKPGIDWFTNQPRHVAFTWNVYNSHENITLTNEDFLIAYEEFKNTGKEKKKKKENNSSNNKENTNRTTNKDFINSSTKKENTNSSTNKDFINNNCNIDTVLKDFMNYTYQGQKCDCPFHEANSISFERFETDNNKFVCYSTSCEAGIGLEAGMRLIDCINVVQHVKKVGFKEAMIILRDKYYPDHTFTFEEKEKPKKDYMLSFLEEIELNLKTKVISSGFKNIDKILNGGLYSGLYTIGAISSLGKTALILQMADQMADSGQHVLFFSLEMPVNELLSRSISRLMFQDDYVNCKNIGTNQVLYGNAKEYHKEKFEKAFNYYKENIFPNLKIIECPFDTTYKYITKVVNSYIEKTGIKPIIMIDYLQIINISKEDITEKRGIDNIVKALKQLSRDLKLVIIVVSSFNRESYNNPVTFNSFKESGGIEYTSDFVLGLQLSILDDLKDNIKNINGFNSKLQEAKKGNNEGMREVSLVILKNRNGVSNSIQKLKFYGKNNMFSESTPKDTVFKTVTEQQEEELNKLKQERFEEEKKKKIIENKTKENFKKKKYQDEILSKMDIDEIIEKELIDLRKQEAIKKAKEKAKILYEEEKNLFS